MPLDGEILDGVRAIHDELMACGRFNEAVAVRYAVTIAMSEQDEEERFGTDRISACVDAISNLRSALVGLAETPITAGDVSRVLKASVPQISLIVEAEDGPTWLRNMAVPINGAVRRLVSELQTREPDNRLHPGGQIRLAECISSLRIG